MREPEGKMEVICSCMHRGFPVASTGLLTVQGNLYFIANSTSHLVTWQLCHLTSVSDRLPSVIPVEFCTILAVAAAGPPAAGGR